MHVGYVNLKLICNKMRPLHLCVCVCECVWAKVQELPHLERTPQLLNSIGQMKNLRVHLVHQCLQFVHRVENLNALGVRVETHLEGTRHGAHPTAELVLGILETLGHIVDGLILLILVGLHSSHSGLEGAMLALVADGVQQLAVGAEQTGTVGLHLTVLLAQTELDGEPVDLPMKRSKGLQ